MKRVDVKESGESIEERDRVGKRRNEKERRRH